MNAPERPAWWENVLSLVFPPVCQVCHAERSSAAEGYVGTECRERIRLIRDPFCQRCGLPFAGAVTQEFACSNCQDTTLHFAYARAVAEAKGPLLEVIHQFKYNRALWFRVFLSELLLREAVPRLETAGNTWHGVVPVPLHPVKQREREFNQAELLAEPLARRLRLPLRTDLVQRIHSTESQTTLSREARAENVHRAFLAMPDIRIQDQRLIVVDDVFTTGATTNGVARALRAAGAAEVVVWAVARGV